MVLTGSCMCGAIAYSSDAEPALTALCHCVDCQKWTGGPCTSNVVVPRDSFKVTKGSPATFDINGASGKCNRHFFCSTCGSSLYTELDIMPDKTCIKAGGLDNGHANLWDKVETELYTKDRVSYMKEVPGAQQQEAM